MVAFFWGPLRLKFQQKPSPTHEIFFASSSLLEILLSTAELCCTVSLRGVSDGEFAQIFNFHIFGTADALKLG